MKLAICDVCYSENKIVKSKYRTGFSGGVKIDVCEDHRGIVKGMSQDQFIKKVLELTEKNNSLLNKTVLS